MPIVPGQSVGQYRALEKIGEGGMGAVYKAEQSAIHRTVVLKVLSANIADNPEMLDRFKRELDIIARLEHPHILPVYDFGEFEGNPYIVMRYMGGGSLASRLESRSMSPEQILHCFEQIADALDYAHDRNIVHRDIKPANILLDERGNAYLADFGLAKTLEGSSELTKTGSILGTPAYMSPEQARGEKLDRRSDIYSLGILAYEALAGRKPFESGSTWDMLRLHLTELAPSITSFNPELPVAVESVMGATLAKDPGERPNRASDLVRSLKAALAGAGIGADAHIQPSSQPSTQAAVANVTGARTGLSASPASRATALTTGPTTLTLPPTAAVAIPAALVIVVLGLSVLAAVGIGAFVFRDRLFGTPIATYVVGDSPRAILFDGQAIWVANGLDNTLSQLAASGCGPAPDSCGQALGTFPVDDLPVGLAFDGQSLWVANALHGNLSKVDPHNGQVLGTFKLPNIPTTLIFAHDGLWAANQFAKTVTHVGLDGNVIGDYPVDGGPVALTADSSSVWVANQDAGTLQHIDPASGATLGAVGVEGQPSALAFDGEQVWAALTDKNEVVEIDPADGSILHRVAVGKQPIALLFDGTSVWVANQVDGTITRIDARTAEVTSTLHVNGQPYALAWTSCGAGCGDLWIVDSNNDTVFRVRVK